MFAVRFKFAIQGDARWVPWVELIVKVFIKYEKRYTCEEEFFET